MIAWRRTGNSPFSLLILMTHIGATQPGLISFYFGLYAYLARRLFDAKPLSKPFVISCQPHPKRERETSMKNIKINQISLRFIVCNCPAILFMGRWGNALQWHHNERDGVSNLQPRGCLPTRLFRRRSKKISKLRVTGLSQGNSPVTGEFPAKGPVTRKMFHFMTSSWDSPPELFVICMLHYLTFYPTIIG